MNGRLEDEPRGHADILATVHELQAENDQLRLRIQRGLRKLVLGPVSDNFQRNSVRQCESFIFASELGLLCVPGEHLFAVNPLNGWADFVEFETRSRLGGSLETGKKGPRDDLCPPVFQRDARAYRSGSRRAPGSGWR